MLLHAFETTCRYEKELVQQEGMIKERNATSTAHVVHLHLQNDSVSVHIHTDHEPE